MSHSLNTALIKELTANSEIPIPVLNKLENIVLPQYYYREDIGIVKITTEKQLNNARSSANRTLFSTEHECTIEYYKNRRSYLLSNVGIAETKLKEETNKLNELDLNFAELRKDHPEYFL